MKTNYPIKATYIDELTYDMPAINWSNEQWVKEFDFMQEVGIDTIVLTKGWFDSRCLYPSKIFPSLKKDGEDFLGLILSEAQKRNIAVFIGGYMSSTSWNSLGVEEELEKNERFADEVIDRYGHFGSFKGWHIPHEVCSSGNISQLLTGLCSIYKSKTPDKLIMYSAKFRSTLTSYSDYTPERTVREWNIILDESAKYIDILTFQDGTVNVNKYQEYIKSAKIICDKHNIKLWANVEMFERDVRKMYFPINFDLLRKKIEIANDYVENYITYEFSRFLSPQSIFESAKKLNCLYKKYYGQGGEENE